MTAEIHNNGGDGKGLRIIGANISNGTLVLRVENGDGHTLLKVQGNGNVGIGTTNMPGNFKLFVKGGILTERLRTPDFAHLRI